MHSSVYVKFVEYTSRFHAIVTAVTAVCYLHNKFQAPNPNGWLAAARPLHFILQISQNYAVSTAVYVSKIYYHTLFQDPKVQTVTTPVKLPHLWLVGYPPFSRVAGFVVL